MYRCGMGYKLAAALDVAAFDIPGPLEPHVVCDSCGEIKSGLTRNGDMTAWLRNRKAPPGWLLLRADDSEGRVKREDYCPKCRLATG